MVSVPAGARRPRLASAPPSPEGTDRIRVLIADDDETIRQTLVEAIERN